MTDPAPSAIARARSAAELEAALPDIQAAPKDDGVLEMIVARADHGVRVVHGQTDVSLAGGVPGDYWIRECHLTDDAGASNPDVQICIMPSRVIRAIAGGPEFWPPAGDNFFIDMDLTPGNMPPGTAFAIGTAEFVVTAEPHNGCASFIARYGREACVFVNTGLGKDLRFRGIYARVTRDGTVAVGDQVRKLG